MSNPINPRPVLILGASARIAVPIARMLDLQCGVPVEVASLNRSDETVRSRSVRDFTRLPDFRASRTAFNRELLALVRERQFDMIIPVQDAALTAVAENYEWLTGLLTVACPPPHVVQRVLDKQFTLNAAQRCGIRVPKTCAVSSIGDIESAGNQQSYPVVVKPAGMDRAGSFKALYFRQQEDLLKWLTSNQGGSWLVQEYCPGEGVGIEMLIHGGECLACFQHRRLKEHPASGGVAVLAIAEPPDKALVDASRKLLGALEWEGVAMVEFRQNPADGTAALMEVNGRFWGTTSLPLQAGLQFPVYQWRLLHGQEPKIPERYTVGVRWRWTAGYLERTHRLLVTSAVRSGQDSRWKAMADLLADCLNPAVRDAIWSFSDPIPGLREMASTVKGLLKADAKALFRQLAPTRLIQKVEKFRSFRGEERAIYLKLKLLNSVGLANERRRRVRPGAHSFVFVCHGNIMRSALCGALFRKELDALGQSHIRVISAGLHAQAGKPADARALVAAEELGVSLGQHRARLLTPEMIDEADTIFAMDLKNLIEILARYPSARPKVLMMSCYADSSDRNLEVEDPYFGDLEQTRCCFRILSTCIGNLTVSLFPSARAQRGNDSLCEVYASPSGKQIL